MSYSLKTTLNLNEEQRQHQNADLQYLAITTIECLEVISMQKKGEAKNLT